MRIGFVGLGKLGYPVAVAMASRKAEVVGTDLDPAKMSFARRPEQEMGPTGWADFYDWVEAECRFPITFRMRFGSLAEIVDHAEIIFVAVQTPHQPQFEGIAPLQERPRDFDYLPLQKALTSIGRAIQERVSPDPTIPIVAIISTVLPGTTRTHLRQCLPDWVPLVYTPSFIAMGTVVRDFLHPEFVLIGGDDEEAVGKVSRFYGQLLPTPVPHRVMSIESAEATKVLYNTWITWKIILANTAMQLCHLIPGAQVDQVTSALQAAHRRITSPAYMQGGMGDGGGCHPRDNIALSWLATKLGLAYDPFGDAMQIREKQAAWLATLCVQHSVVRGQWLPIVIAGYAFKAQTTIITGSPAILTEWFLRDWGHKPRLWDPHIALGDTLDTLAPSPSIILVGCRHALFEKAETWQGVATGSTIIDPFRMVPRRDGVTVVPVGVGG